MPQLPWESWQSNTRHSIPHLYFIDLIHFYGWTISSLSSSKGYVNRVPGAELFREKTTQWRILNQLYELFPEEFKFHPQSFLLPKDLNELEKSIKENPKKLLIAKPSEGGGGGGIFLFKSTKDLSGLSWTQDWVVQRYVPKPLLINKKKWDMRVYVMIHGVNPMKAYLATEYGLARFWTEDYDTSNTHNIFSHLTNYSLNKNSDGYVKDQELNDESTVFNSKMSLTDVWKLVQKFYPDVDIESDWKQKMRDLVVNVLSATRSTIELRYVELMGQKINPKENNKFYQILGFDIMFDEDFGAWLFEVNAYPSMEIFYERDNADGTTDKEKSEVDELVKGKIFAESAKLLMTGEENDTLELVYDSEDISDSSWLLYETVFGIYKTLWGVKLTQMITISKFSKLAKYLPKSMNITKIDLELLFKRLQYEDHTSIGLVSFFSALNTLAKKNDTNLESLANEISENIGR